jgi:hypothetical protein
MGWFSRSKTWDPGTAEPPWRGGASIYDHIKKHLLPDGGLSVGGERLPDETDDGGIKWVAGGFDGAFGHHGGGGSAKDRAKMLYRTLSVALDDAAPGKLKKLYDHLVDGAVLDFIDPLLALIIEKGALDAGRLHRAGIRSPVIRNRHMALRALSRWGIERWPSGAEAVLRATLADEPDKDVRAEIELLLAGNQIEDPHLEVS